MMTSIFPKMRGVLCTTILWEWDSCPYLTQEEIEKWFDYMVGKGYKNTYTNGIYAIFRVIMNWAAKKKVIPADQTGDVVLLKNDRKPLKIITQDEFKALFVKDWRKVWEDDLIACLGNKLAALTGMRAGEVLGLRGENVQESHIQVYKQYDKFGYRDTKTKDKRNIPIPPLVMGELRELMAVNGDGYLFSHNGGSKPVPTRYFYDAFLEELEKIGMGKEEIKKRGLCFHAWRHLCNTELQKASNRGQRGCVFRFREPWLCYTPLLESSIATLEKIGDAD